MEFSKEEIKQRYHSMGLETRVVVDEPGTVYESHRHQGVRLFTLRGTATVKLDDAEWRNVKAGDELVILDDQLHEARVGNEPWEYIFATTPEEMERQGL